LAEEPHDALHGFRERIRHPNLLRLYDYWAERRRGRSFPSRQDIDPLEFKFARGNVTLIDVLYDPLRFRFRLVGSLMAQRMGFDFTGRMVDEVEDASYRDSIIKSYREIVENRRPNRLPLAADGETINMLLLCPQYFEPLPERSPLAPAAIDSAEAPKIVGEA
jgi:hypothetical protein